jgi:multiple sugar transport system substrate-binding protein
MKLHSKIMAAALVGTATVSGMLTGVSSGSTLAAPRAAGASVTTIKLDDDKTTFTPGYDAMSRLAAQQIHISLEVNPFSNETTFQTTVLSGAAAGEKPALFTWHTGGEMQEVVTANEVTNTSSIWKQDIANGTLPASLEPYYTISGQQYCVPETLDYWGMYYNKTIFSKYNLTVPTTWAELMSDAATLKAHGQTPFYEVDGVFAFVWFEMLLGQENPTAYNELTAGRISWTSAPVVQTMQLWKSLIEDGYMSNPTVTTNQYNVFAAGDVAMDPSGTWLNASFSQLHFTPKQYGFFLVPNVNPKLPKDVTFLETSPLCASPGVSTTAKAQEVLQWWNTTPAQTVWSKTQLDISENPKVPVPVEGFAAIDNDVKNGSLEPLERYYEAVPATVLTESLNDFSAFEANPNSYMTQLRNIQKVAAKAYGKSA